MKPSIAYNLTGGALYGWVAIPSHVFLQLAPRSVNSAGSGRCREWWMSQICSDVMSETCLWFHIS